jgi:hypothetical protein
MALITQSQNSFAGGCFSPSIFPRVDLDKYRTGVKTLDNFTVHPYGGISNRPGFRYVNTVKNAAQDSILVNFVFSEIEAYALEFGDQYIRFYTDGAQIQNLAVAYEVTSPYLEADLEELRFEASADVIFITHPDYQPRTLTRLGNASWTLAILEYDDGPFMLENTDESLSLTASALTGLGVLLTLTAPVDANTVLLYHFDGSNGSTDAIEETGKPSTFVSSAQISTAQSVFGGSSAIFGVGDYAYVGDSTDFDWTGDFSIEMRIKSTENGTERGLLTNRLDNQSELNIYKDSSNIINVSCQSPDGAGEQFPSFKSTTAITIAKGWTDFKVIRTSGTVKLYIDGVEEDSVASTTTISSSQGMAIGTFDISNTSRSWVGYIDEVRLSKDSARASTVATAAFDLYTATSAFSFAAAHEDALFKITHYIGGQADTTTFTSATVGSSISCFRTWRLITHGTWTGRLSVEKSSDGGTTWTILRAFSSADDNNLDTSGTEDTENNPEPFLVRLNMYTYGSGTATCDLTTDPFYQDGIVRVQTYTSATVVKVEVLDSIGTTAATTIWSEGSWSDYRGWPRGSSFFQDRLVFASTTTEPMTVWMTQTGNYYSFRRNSPLLDTDGITVNLPSRQVNVINGLVPLNRLVVLTSASEWSIGSGTNSALTPTTVEQKNEGYRGSSGVPPIVIGNEIIYVQAGGKVIRSLGYDYSSDSFTGGHLNILAMHYFDGHQIKSLCYQQDPDSIVWALRDDGDLIGLTYMREQEVIAWHHHDTDGSFTSSMVIPNATNNFDELWVIVDRDAGTYVERLSLRSEDMLFLDAAVTYVNNGSDVYTGLTHLNGETVTSVADGVTSISSTVVAGGTVTLASSSYVNVAIGLPYLSDVELLDMDIPWKTGSMQQNPVKVGNVAFILQDSRGGYIGPDSSSLWEAFTQQAFRESSGQNIGATDDFTGKFRTSLGGSYSKGGGVFYRQSDPFGITIGAIIREATVGEPSG